MLKKVYLDTTIPSFYYENRTNLEFESKITKQWWDEERFINNKLNLFTPEIFTPLELFEEII